MKNMKITHLSVYQISKDGVFDNVNSYSEMNEQIKLYGVHTPGAICATVQANSG